MNVVVVESPAKAKTIEKYLGANYKVLATYGHVCDLPSKDGSVRPDEDFAMSYVNDAKSEKHLKEIASYLGAGDSLLLATDPDREGEAISWHVLNYLKAKSDLSDVQVSRIVFHEITRDAVRHAAANPRDIDMDLVNAQQARRALDYLVGFTLSPVLWRKLPGARSAGRVQSVALRLICAREQEIEAFKPREYWTVDTVFTTAAGQPITARLTHLGGDKLDKFSLGDEAAAHKAVAEIEARAFSVATIDRKQVKRNPPPPFTTSTLQQDASRKLGLSARDTMRVAQRLYEGVDIGGETAGLISYMRTDSVTLSNEAVNGCRAAIEADYGKRYLPDEPRRYRTKSKNAQEAHEAIRPTDPRRRPRDIAARLGREEARLYELIWKRTMACQMATALIDQVGVDIAGPDRQVVLRATGSVVAFDGFMKLYSEGRDENGNGGDTDDRRLPQVAEGESLERGAVTPDQHFTEPPPRYSEATLVKGMEELGIGRPSTYANIISVLQDRDYVVLDKKRFRPESRGRLVTSFLESFFGRYVEYDFTADLEDQLDRISNGELEWKSVLRDFWTAFSSAVDDISDLRVREVLDRLDEVIGPHLFAATDDGRDPRACSACDDGRLGLKLGKYGAFIGCSNYPECRFTRQLTANDADDPLAAGPRLLGQNGDGEDVTLRKGPYGVYIQLGEPEGKEKPKRVSLLKTMSPDQIDLEMALAMLSLPRDVGAHPQDGKMILAGIGRYGSYLNHDGKYRSLRSDDDVLTIGLNRAVSLLAEPGRGRKTATPIQVLGAHPDDGAEVSVLDGRYGPYFKHNKTFVTVPKDMDPAKVTLAQALPLIAAKAAKKKPAKKKAGAKKTGAKKTGAKTTRKTTRKKKPAAEPVKTA